MGTHIVNHNQWRLCHEDDEQLALSVYVDRKQAFPRAALLAILFFMLFCGVDPVAATGAVAFSGPVMHWIIWGGTRWPGAAGRDGLGQGSGLSTILLLFNMVIDHIILMKELRDLEVARVHLNLVAHAPWAAGAQ